jgi:uncharacterized membrane protein YgcG
LSLASAAVPRRVVLSLLFLAAFAAPARAAEEILLFQSDIAIGQDGVLTVTETIRVNSEGQQIRRGIFRDFPNTVQDARGRIRKNSFDLISVLRDGEPEGYRIERAATFLRIYIGKEDLFLEPGVHSYRIAYRTDRQVRQFDTQDELFWNVTGTEWQFPIEQARAQVSLPGDAVSVGTTYFTGPVGSRDKKARATLADGGHRVLFETTAPLGPREGLTIGVKFAKGSIAPPTGTQRLRWFLRDNAAALFSVGGLAVVLLYYLWAWGKVGRDPPKGVAVPRWDLPDGVSPALAHYIRNKGFQDNGFPAISAAALSLAVKGYATLDRTGADLSIRQTGRSWSGSQLPAGEAALMGAIAGYGGSLVVTKANGEKVQSLASRFRTAMEAEHRSVYYRFNRAWIAVGVLLSILAAIAVVVWGGVADGTLAILVPGLLFGAVVTAMAVGVGKGARTGLAGKLQLVILAFIAGAIITNSGILTASGILSGVPQSLPLMALATLLMVNVLFFFLMGAPTPLGRRRMDEIEGLRTYLKVAEEQRMNLAGAPEMSPRHYETLLPYAVALGVEKPWSKAFQKWLAAAVAAGAASAAAYHGPSWYQARGDLQIDDIGSTMGSLASDLSKSFTASLPTPQSSSSGFSSGGGFSGGGGGGGGGGGW